MADIILVRGLLAAMKKGEGLEEAMVSFYNAGYERSEIEKAARAVQSGQQGQPVVPVVPYSYPKKKEPENNQKRPTEEKQIQKPIQKNIFKPMPGQQIQRVSAYGDNAESIKKIKSGIKSAIEQLNRIEFPNGKSSDSVPAPSQGVSTYGEKPKKNGAIIAIIISLIILLGLLAGVFVFRDSILSFFDKSGFFNGLFGG